MQTFSLSCFSSSNRVGGVAHDCVKTALKPFFPDYTLLILSKPNFQSIPNGCELSVFDFALFAQDWAMSTYLIVDSTLRGGAFITDFGFLIFPSLSDYFPPGELIRTLASEK